MHKAVGAIFVLLFLLTVVLMGCTGVGNDTATSTVQQSSAASLPKWLSCVEPLEDASYNFRTRPINAGDECHGDRVTLEADKLCNKDLDIYDVLAIDADKLRTESLGTQYSQDGISFKLVVMNESIALEWDQSDGTEVPEAVVINGTQWGSVSNAVGNGPTETRLFHEDWSDGKISSLAVCASKGQG